MKGLPKIPAAELAALQVRHDRSGWYATDAEGNIVVALPASLSRREFNGILQTVLAHEKRGLNDGKAAGMEMERERIMYGFRVALSPITDRMPNHNNHNGGTSAK